MAGYMVVVIKGSKKDALCAAKKRHIQATFIQTIKHRTSLKVSKKYTKRISAWFFKEPNPQAIDSYGFVNGSPLYYKKVDKLP